MFCNFKVMSRKWMEAAAAHVRQWWNDIQHPELSNVFS